MRMPGPTTSASRPKALRTRRTIGSVSDGTTQATIAASTLLESMPCMSSSDRSATAYSSAVRPRALSTRNLWTSFSPSKRP